MFYKDFPHHDVHSKVKLTGQWIKAIRGKEKVTEGRIERNRSSVIKSAKSACVSAQARQGYNVL